MYRLTAISLVCLTVSTTIAAAATGNGETAPAWLDIWSAVSAFVASMIGGGMTIAFQAWRDRQHSKKARQATRWRVAAALLAFQHECAKRAIYSDSDRRTTNKGIRGQDVLAPDLPIDSLLEHTENLPADEPQKILKLQYMAKRHDIVAWGNDQISTHPDKHWIGDRLALLYEKAGQDRELFEEKLGQVPINMPQGFSDKMNRLAGDARSLEEFQDNPGTVRRRPPR
jgi:hypothetical protein